MLARMTDRWEDGRVVKGEKSRADGANSSG